MNIAVINAKDLIKYILKFFIIISIILILVKGIKNISSMPKEKTVKQAIENTTSRNKGIFIFKLFRLKHITNVI